ncbi:MAG: hypothetical protein ACHQNA_02810 [Acidimicrobiales bacterium]
MAIEVPPSRVPLGGSSPRVAVAVAVVALLSVVGFAVLGKAPGALAPSHAPTPSPSLEAAAIPSSAPTCVTPVSGAVPEATGRHPRALAPTGFETLTPWGGGETALVADVHDGFWALGSGRLTRLDAGGTATFSCTFADDAFFGARGIVAARGGGVWLFGGPAIAWFDGQWFRDVIPLPPTSSSAWIADVGEAADGSLWALTDEPSTVNAETPPYQGRVFHWDGRAWIDTHDITTNAEPLHLVIDTRGGVWVSPVDPTGDVAHFDGTAWSIPPGDASWASDSARRASSDAGAVELVAATDGSVWMAAGGLAHFSATSWTSVQSDAVTITGTVALAVAPDGTVWLTTPGGLARFDGRAWTVYNVAQGLMAAAVTAVAASRDGVLVASTDGFYRLSGARWARVGPRPVVTVLGRPPVLSAVSSNAAWTVFSNGAWTANGNAGLWHVQNGTWTSVPVAGWDTPVQVYDLASSPDGALAVATNRGAAVLRDGHWTVLDTGVARALTFARDGALWVAEQAPGSAQTTVVAFRLNGGTWVSTACPSLTAPGGLLRIALGPDGEPWVGSAGYFGSFDRFDGARWVPVAPLGGSEGMANVLGLVTASNGDLWVAPSSQSEQDWALAGYDGLRWIVLRPADSLAEPGHLRGPNGLAIGPDGRLWAATDRGLLLFDGRGWSLRFAGYGFDALSFAPDGTLWAIGPSGVQRLSAGTLVGP